MLTKNVVGIVVDEGEGNKEGTDKETNGNIEEEDEVVEVIFIFSEAVEDIDCESVFFFLFFCFVLFFVLFWLVLVGFGWFWLFLVVFGCFWLFLVVFG